MIGLNGECGMVKGDGKGRGGGGVGCTMNGISNRMERAPMCKLFVIYLARSTFGIGGFPLNW